MRTLSLLFLFLAPLSLFAQLTPQTEAKIDQLFSHVNATTPGYAVAVIQDTSFLYKKGYGMAHLEYDIPITSRSVFNVASLSKQFTAACVALLMLDKKLSLEDSVYHFFSEFPEHAKGLQIKHLIYMTSGINDYYYNPRANGSDWSSLHFFSVDTAIAASLGDEALMYEPGTRWSYSNINYMLLTKIVEKVSGQRFATFAKERLFKPLGMTQSLIHDDLFAVIPNRVMAYNYRDEENTGWMLEHGYLPEKGEGFLQINRHSPHYGGSGVFTSVEDLKKWTDNFHTRAFGGDAFYELMHKRMKFDHPKDNDALGLVFGEFQGHEMVWYEGGDWGVSSYMMRFPKEKLTVICLSNLGTGRAQKYAHQLMEVLLEEGAVNWEP